MTEAPSGRPRDRPLASFEEAFGHASTIPGWLTEDQARILFERGHSLRSGQRIVEIGSHRGRSTVILGLAAAEGVEVVAIDPYSGGQHPVATAQTDQGAGELHLAAFWENLTTAEIHDRVRLVRRSSQASLGSISGDVDLLYIDGAHEVKPALLDIRNWESRVAPGGTMLIHDAFSSIGVTLAQISELFLNRRFKYVGRSRSLAEYRREHVRGASLYRNAMRQSASLPWFIRNVLVKIGLRARAGLLVRLLGHDGTDYPF